MAKTMRQGIFPGMDLPPSADESSLAPPDTDPRFELPDDSMEEPRQHPEPAPKNAMPRVDSTDRAALTPTSLRGQSVWVVDANSLIFQVFHALPEMTSPGGEPVSAVFGFARDMLYLLEQKKPSYVFVAFDGPERTFRHEIFEAYKANRGEMPIDLVPQFAPIHRLLEALGVSVLALDGYEADDLLATVAHQVNALEGECYLVTGDKDCRQLITDLVKVYNVRKDQVYDSNMLAGDWNIRPDQVVDFQALVGDAVDNVPGVPLIGPKIASEYLQKFDTLDALLARVNELPAGKRKDNLIAMRDQALLSRTLVRLDCNVPIQLDWNAAKVGPVDAPALARLFTEWGFHSLAQKYSAVPLSDLAGRKPEAQMAVDYECINTPERFEWLLGELGRQELFSVDTETTNIRPRWAEIVGYSFSWSEGKAYYVPVRAPAGELHLDPAETLRRLRPILENPAIGKLGQNLKYDMVVLRSAGVEMAPARFDTMLASYLLDAGERNHNLDELAAPLPASQHHENRRIDRHGQEPKVHGRSSAGPDHALRGRRRGRGLALAHDSGRAYACGQSRTAVRAGRDAAGRSPGRIGNQWHPSEYGTAGRVERQVRRVARGIGA